MLHFCQTRACEAGTPTIFYRKDAVCGTSVEIGPGFSPSMMPFKGQYPSLTVVGENQKVFEGQVKFT